MSILFNYLSSWWESPYHNQAGTSVDNPIPPSPERVVKSPLSPIPEHPVLLISSLDLLQVKLKPVVNVIPAPARNMPPIDKFQLGILNQAQLKEILSVKLRTVKKPETMKIFEPRHPVLKELIRTIHRK